MHFQHSFTVSQACFVSIRHSRPKLARTGGSGVQVLRFRAQSLRLDTRAHSSLHPYTCSVTCIWGFRAALLQYTLKKVYEQQGANNPASDQLETASSLNFLRSSCPSDCVLWGLFFQFFVPPSLPTCPCAHSCLACTDAGLSGS